MYLIHKVVAICLLVGHLNTAPTNEAIEDVIASVEDLILLLEEQEEPFSSEILSAIEQLKIDISKVEE
jgi:hypothetical protein